MNNGKYKVVSWIGNNKIHYEYIVPYGKTNTFYNDAVSVRSKKTDNPKNKWRSMKNGRKYKPGQYQPIGATRYFNFWQRKKIDESELNQSTITVVIK